MSLELLSGVRKQSRSLIKFSTPAKKPLTKGQLIQLKKVKPMLYNAIKKSNIQNIKKQLFVKQNEPLFLKKYAKVEQENTQANEDPTEIEEEITEDEAPEIDEIGIIYPNFNYMNGRKKPKQPKQPKKQPKFKKAVIKVALAAPRKAVLLLIGLGSKTEKLLKFNLTNRIVELWNKDRGLALKKLWVKYGGKPEELIKAINKGSKIKVSGIGVVLAATAATAVTAATPILLGIADLYLKYKKNKKETPLEETPSEETPGEEETPTEETPTEETPTEETPSEETPQEETPQEEETPTEEISGLNRMRLKKLRRQKINRYIYNNQN